MISKKYFSGFCLDNEFELFDEYSKTGDFIVSGFSYGAILAFKEVYNANTRIDKLQLFSPAFFQTQDKKFKRMQLMFFKKDSKAYCDNFLKNIAHPSSIDTSKYFVEGSYEQLEELLTYEWDEQKLQSLVDNGTKIEVYLGADDKIIDALKAKEFFTKFATVYYIKEKGHIL